MPVDPFTSCLSFWSYEYYEAREGKHFSRSLHIWDFYLADLRNHIPRCAVALES